MEKVCHVTCKHYRYDTRIFNKMCVSLANNGYDVTLLCMDELDNEIKNGVRIVSSIVKFKNKYDRILNGKRKWIKFVSLVDADIYHIHDSELLDVIPYLKKKKKKVIFDSHEDHPQRIIERRKVSKLGLKLRYNIYLEKEKRILKMCDAVISVTPHIVDRLKKINRNTYMVTNYPILIKSKRKQFDRYIVFAGGLAENYNHHRIINAIKDIKDIKYYLAGLSNEYSETLKNIDGFDKVKMIGKIEFNEVLELYNKASIGMCLSSYRPNTNYKEGTLGNTKLFEYMASGVPIICTDYNLWKPIISKYECGICVNPTDELEIKNAIIKILSDPVLMKQMSKNCLRAAEEEFNWKTQEKILLNIYKKLS